MAIQCLGWLETRFAGSRSLASRLPGGKYSLIAAAVLILLPACAVRSTDKAPEEAAAPRSDPLQPFSLKVIDEVYDGKHLYIRAAVDSQVDWDAADVSLVLTSFKDGVVEQVKRLPLSELTGKERLAPEQYIVLLNVPAQHSTDYQLELAWTQEVLGSSDALQLRNVKVEALERCAENVCGPAFVVSAELFNAGRSVVSSAVLGVGYSRNGVVADQEHEEQVPLSDLRLQPSSSRTVRLELDPLPEGIAAKYRPSVRLISFDNAHK